GGDQASVLLDGKEEADIGGIGHLGDANWISDGDWIVGRTGRVRAEPCPNRIGSRPNLGTQKLRTRGAFSYNSFFAAISPQFGQSRQAAACKKKRSEDAEVCSRRSGSSVG
ncbi:hypothetical protein, partial [Paraburkholderia graminis]|uniref:hypothetical protein n=1 Tax=Paraburkholderia graminis TaxID=60548 RepID=UPI00389ACAA1